MKRDLELIRAILLQIEAADSAKERIGTESFLNLNADRNVIAFHLDLLVDAGFIEGIPVTAIGIHDFYVERLTFAGCDYLDAVRDDSVWKSTNERLKAVGSSAALEVVKGVANAVARSALGI